MPFCVACRIDHPRESFSKAQLRKPQENKRCQNCIDFQTSVLEFSSTNHHQHHHHQPATATRRQNHHQQGTSTKIPSRPNFVKDPASMQYATEAAYAAVAHENTMIDAQEYMAARASSSNHTTEEMMTKFLPSSPSSPTSAFENRFNNNINSSKNSMTNKNQPSWPWPSSSSFSSTNNNSNDRKVKSENDDDFVEIIWDDDDQDDGDNKNQQDLNKNDDAKNNNSLQNSDREQDQEDLHHLDKECPICMEEFHWDFSNQTTASQSPEKEHQHPHSPRILPCSHICCNTCISRIISAVRKLNNERRIAEANTRVSALRNSGMIVRRSEIELAAMVHGGNNNNNDNLQNNFFDEKDKRPACPICRREFFVAVDVPREVREKMRMILGKDNNSSNCANSSSKVVDEKQPTLTFNNLQDTLHIASIGNDVPGIIINLNPDRRCGSIALCETGKCVLFFAPPSSSNNKNNIPSHNNKKSSFASDFSMLQIGMRIICNVSEQEGSNANNNNVGTKNRKNIKNLLRGELVASCVRTIEDFAQEEFERKEEERNQRRRTTTINEDDDDTDENDEGFDERRREFTREISVFDQDDENAVASVMPTTNNNNNNRMSDYYYDRSGRRVYAHDDDDYDEEEEEYYDDDDYYRHHDSREEGYDALEEQYDTRYAGF